LFHFAPASYVSHDHEKLLDREETPMPTTQRTNDPQSPYLSAVREGQAAVIDMLRVWSDIGQRLTGDLRLPIARRDLADAVDRAFDLAEQALAAQRQLALLLAGIATRQVDITVDTAVETADTAVEAADTTVETAAGAVRERTHQVEGALQDRRPGGGTYEERSVEELRERAAELQIAGRSSMGKEELIAALRDHRKTRSGRSDTARNQSAKPDPAPNRRTYEDRSVEELRERARELEIEGRSTMSKEELIAALRRQAK
jgi:hypothetical protein